MHRRMCFLGSFFWTLGGILASVKLIKKLVWDAVERRDEADCEQSASLALMTDD
jgi:hypothetical protein